jgi:hypothetical protein
VSSTLLAEKVDLPLTGSFAIRDGARIVEGGITRGALQDLADYHRLRGTEEEVFDALRGEIERLATWKYCTGRFEESGELLIRATDLLRYGFGGAAGLAGG